MKKSVLALLSILTLSTAMFAVALSPQSVNAATCNGVETSIDYHCDQYDTDSASALLMYVINFMAIGVGIAVVAGIAWGGLTYARSGGDSGAAKQGIDTIRNAVIALVLFIGMWGLANFFIPGGAFNLNGKIASFNPTTSSPKAKSTTSTPKTTTGTTGSSAAATLAAIDKFNFRDASGSGVLKSGVLYRSGYLAKVPDNKKDLEALLKGGKVIDLRTSADKKTYGADPDLVGVAQKNIAITGTTDYTKFVNGDAGKTASAAFGKAIKEIINTDGPVLIHCTHGKDRTGWLVAMIMYALGGTDAQVMEEYKRSAGQTDGTQVTEAMLNAGLSAIKSNKAYGTVQKYLTKGLGLTDADIAALKAKLGA